MLSLAPSSGRAQAIVGAAEKPAVEVDQSVLDRLGATPTLPDRYLNRDPVVPRGAPSSGPIILKRPSQQRPVEIRPTKPQAPTIVKPAKPPKGGDPVEASPAKPPKPMPTPAVKPEPKAEPTPIVKPIPAPKPEKTDGIPPRPPVETPSVVDPDPVAPEKPVEPVKPVEPTKLVEPVKPVEPTKLVEPVKPVEPAKPVESVKPVEPTKPVETSSPRRGGALLPGTAAPPINHSWGGVGVPMRSSDSSGASLEAGVVEAPLESQSQVPPEPAAPTVVKPVSPPKEPPPLPTQLTPAVEGRTSVSFIKDSAEISPESEAILGNIARKMAQQPDLTVLLQAFASTSGESASRARHMSLSRALAVRSKLIESGVRSTRIEVRALGDKVDGGDPERVDLILQKRDKN